MLIIIISGAFLSVLNQTIMNTALPSIMAELSVSAPTAQWLISGFTLVNAIIVPISAFLMGKFKTKSLFLSAFGIFFAGSLLAAWGVSFPILLLGRLLQAVCAGIMLPLSMTTLLLIVRYEKRGSAMGIMTFIVMFAPAIGPVISGVLVDEMGWRFIFAIMAALSAIILSIAAITMKSYDEKKDVALDIPSVLLCVAGLFGLLYGASMLRQPETLIVGCVMIVIGGLILAFFSKRQLKLNAPFLQIGVFADKQFRIGVILIMLFSFSLIGATVTMPLYIQNIRGMSATASGIIIMPGAIIGAIVALFSGRLADRIGSRPLVITGIIIVIIGSVGMSFFEMTTPVWAMTLFYCIRSAGLMFANTPINLWAISNLSNERLVHGNAITNTMQQIGNSLGTTIMVSVMSFAASVFGSELLGIKATFYLSVIIAAAAFVLVLLYVKSKKTHSGPEKATELDSVMNAAPPTIKASDIIGTAVSLFIEHRTSLLPVVDNDKRLIGCLFDGDVVRYLANQDMQLVNESYTFLQFDNVEVIVRAKELLQKCVMEIAAKRIIVINHNMPISHICRMFYEQKLNKLPVTKDGVLIGTISRVDIMRGLMSQLPSLEKN